jgi:hypothetical protein
LKWKVWLPLLALTTMAFVSYQKSQAPPVRQSLLVKTDFVPFIPGEKLVFNLHYGMVNAGQASLEVANTEKRIAGQNHYEIDVKGSSNTFFDPFYKVRDRYESYINDKTILPTVFIRDIQEGSYRKSENYIFVRAKNEVVSGKKTFPVPPDIHDLVSTFYYLRCIDFSKQKPGASFAVTAFFDESLLSTGIRYIGRETIKTHFGQMHCYVLKPILVKGRIFENQDDMTLYVSEDKNQIPVRIQSKVYLDFVRADIQSYQNLKYPLTALEKSK